MVELYGADGVEVEFVQASGQTKALLTLRPSDLRSLAETDILLTQKPSRPCQEIGILTYRAGTGEKYANVVQYMREKAAQLGADGIIMMDSSAGPSMPVV